MSAVLITKLTPAQIEALTAGRDHGDAYRISEGLRRANRYERAARTRVVQSLHKIGLVEGSEITDAGVQALSDFEDTGSLTVERFVEIIRRHAGSTDYVDSDNPRDVIIDGHYNVEAIVAELNGKVPR